MHIFASALKNASRMRFDVPDLLHLMHAAYGCVVMHVGICPCGGLAGGGGDCTHGEGPGYLPHFAIALRSPIEGRGQRGRRCGAATD